MPRHSFPSSRVSAPAAAVAVARSATPTFASLVPAPAAAVLLMVVVLLSLVLLVPTTAMASSSSRGLAAALPSAAGVVLADVPPPGKARDAFVRALRDDVLSRLRHQQRRQATASSSSDPGCEIANHIHHDPQRDGEGSCPAAVVSDEQRTEADAPPSEVAPALPDPPRALGVHTPCKKFGRGCPDTYISFLLHYREELPPARLTPREGEGGRAGEEATTATDSAWRGSAEDGRRRRGGAARPTRDGAGTADTRFPFPVNAAWSPGELSQLEDLQHYSAVLEEKLRREGARRRWHGPPGDARRGSTSTSSSSSSGGGASSARVAALPPLLPPVGHCAHYTASAVAVEAMMWLRAVVTAARRFVVWRLLPCAGGVAAVAWVFTWDAMTWRAAAVMLARGAATAPPPPSSSSSSTPAERQRHQQLQEGGREGRPVARSTSSPAAHADSTESSAGEEEEGDEVATTGGATAASPTESSGDGNDEEIGDSLAAAAMTPSELRAWLLVLRDEQATPLLFLRLRIALTVAAAAVVASAAYAFFWHLDDLCLTEATAGAMAATPWSRWVVKMLFRVLPYSVVKWALVYAVGLVLLPTATYTSKELMQAVSALVQRQQQVARMQDALFEAADEALSPDTL